MNGKKSKLIRRKAEGKLIDWLRTMIPEGEDVSKINKKMWDSVWTPRKADQIPNF